jgi:hypothetical protein
MRKDERKREREREKGGGASGGPAGPAPLSFSHGAVLCKSLLRLLKYLVHCQLPV